MRQTTDLVFVQVLPLVRRFTFLLFPFFHFYNYLNGYNHSRYTTYEKSVR